MGLVLMLLKNYWKQALLAVLVSTLAYTGYYKIKDIGREEANVECAARMKAYNDRLDNLIVKIEESSTKLVTESQEARLALKKDFGVILSTIKNKPLYVIEQGKCAPSVEFIDIYNKAIDRVNAQ